MKKKILILGLKNIKQNRRMYRQVKYLKDIYDVSAMGYDSPEIEGVPFYKIIPQFKYFSSPEKAWVAFLILFGFYKLAYKHMYKYDFKPEILSQQNYDLIIVHDLRPFPLIDGIINPSTPIICDAHEYYLDMGGTNSLADYILNKLDASLTKKYLYGLKYITTVGNWIAEEYKRITQAQVYVITSASEYHNLQPLPVDPKKIKIIHHGLAVPDRKTEIMIQAADFLDERFSIDIMMITLTFDEQYLDYLKKMCGGKKNVRIIPPVDASDLVAYTNTYDIGLFVLPSSLLSHAHALPNKIFEYVQARLMVAVSPNPEMKTFVEKYNVGMVASDYTPKAMANLLNSLSAEQITQYKMNSHSAAKELSAENEMIKLKNIINTII